MRTQRQQPQQIHHIRQRTQGSVYIFYFEELVLSVADPSPLCSLLSPQNKQWKGHLTEPKTPLLHTSLRARPPKVKSSLEIEQEELEKLPKFKAKPLNKKVLYLCVYIIYFSQCLTEQSQHMLIYFLFCRYLKVRASWVCSVMSRNISQYLKNFILLLMRGFHHLQRLQIFSTKYLFKIDP